MDERDYEDEVGKNSGARDFEEGLTDDSKDNACFDASQYAFFGNDVLEEVELGGLEDDDDDGGVLFGGLDDQDYQFSSTLDGEEVNNIVVEPMMSERIGNRLPFPSEGSSGGDWLEEVEYTNWLDKRMLETETADDNKRWNSLPHSSFDAIEDVQPLNRATSYPQHLPQTQLAPSGPILLPGSSFSSYPSSGVPFQTSPGLFHHPNAPSHTSRQQFPFPMADPQHSIRPQITGAPFNMQYEGNMGQLNHVGTPTNGRLQNTWSNQKSQLSVLDDHSDLQPNLIPRQLYHSNGSRVGTQFSPHGQLQMLHLGQPKLPHYPPLQPQATNSPPHLLNKYEMMLGMVNQRDYRSRPMHQNGQIPFHTSQISNIMTSQRGASAWPPMRSKYMSAAEIENIARIQHAATHSGDPYVDDYYHQACLAKNSDGSRLRHHFCPTQLRDLPSGVRSTSEPHEYLHVDALGRLPFSSVRRPRPLLEVDPPSATTNGVSSTFEQKSQQKPLEQEPLLAARIIIEDGLCLILDVDDINRFLEFNQQQDGGSQLRNRRWMLLTNLATSLHIVDPLDSSNGNCSTVLSSKDDFVFLLVASLPKGRKLLSRYVKLLFQHSSEIGRIVCMAIFRHLRFLFGSLPSDISLVKTTTSLVVTVSSCIRGMELNALSACLAAVVCSIEKPPLRPIGCPSGDGASILIQAILDRATELLTNPNSSQKYTVSHRKLWQASFDSFFKLLTQYCISKYESIMQSFVAQTPDVAKAINRELPVELLRSSLPHTSENQKKFLLEFAQRSVTFAASNAHGANNPVSSG